MLRLIAPQSIPGFFANAGQAAVERALVQTLPDTGRVHVCILALGDADDQAQLAEYCRPHLRDARVSIVPFDPSLPADLLAGYDGLILHGLSPFPTVRRWLRRARATRRLPVVQHIHSLFLVEFELRLYAQLWAGWQGWPPAAWVVPTHNTARRAQLMPGMPSAYPPMTVVPHGILGDEIKTGDRGRGRRLLDASGDDLVLLSLARLSSEKCDYVQLVHAMHALRQTSPLGGRLLLALAGGLGPDDVVYMQRVRALVDALGLRERVRIIDNLDEDKKADVLAAADLFVSLARNPQESFGIALLEAQAAGLPIVASDWNGYPEVLPPCYHDRMVPTVASRACARTLNWRRLSDATAIDFTALVGLLRRFLEDPVLREEVARDGREHAGRFTWRATAERLVAVWEELDARHRAGPAERASALRADHLTWRGAAQRLVALWEPRPRPSPVEGLATHYTDPALRFRVGTALPPSFDGEGIPPRARDLLAANAGQIMTVAEWRNTSGLSAMSSDRLFLQLVRSGAVAPARA